MNDSLRKTVQYMLTGLLGLIISQVFGCLLAWGMFKTSDSTHTVFLDTFVGKWYVPFFLIVLALNFFRIGHGLVLLESDAERFQSYKSFISKRTRLSLFQIIVLLSFVGFGVVLLRTLSGNIPPLLGVENSDDVGFLSMLLFALLCLWDIPTAIFYFKDWVYEEKKIEAKSQIEAFKMQVAYFKEKWEGDIVFKSVIIWAFYDIVCFAAVLVEIIFLKFGNNGQLIYSSVWLSLILFLDYFPILLFCKGKPKDAFRRFTNCELYFED